MGGSAYIVVMCTNFRLTFIISLHSIEFDFKVEILSGKNLVKQVIVDFDSSVIYFSARLVALQYLK